MTVSLTKSRSVVKHLLILFCVASASLWAAVDLDHSITFDSRFGYHLREPIDLATHRHTLNIEEKLKTGPVFSAVAGLRARVEGGLAGNEERYGNSKSAHDLASELVIRNLFVEHKYAGLSLRAGNQQVVWGEAFGFYFSDIVNPKDLTEIGLGDLEANRIPVPMLNAKWASDESSLQLIYIPKPLFNKVAMQGSDFFALGNAFSGSAINIDDQRTVPWAFENGEVGARATTLLSGFDVAVFGFYYFDRMANYTARATPLGITLDGRHERIYSLGTTVTYDLGSVLVRAEGVLSKGRSFDVLSGATLVASRSDEWVGVLEADYTKIESWRFGFQIAHTHLMEDIQPLLLQRDTLLISFLVNGKTWRDHAVDLIATYGPKDGSSLLRASYLVPLSNRMELALGADFLSGGSGSVFGKYSGASRAYLTFKAYL